MGWGDEIIATGQARVLQESNPRQKVIIRDRTGAIRKHEMWRNNPRILGRHEPASRHVHELVNGPSVRPYIAGKSEERWTWREWDCPRGEIYFSPDEIAFAERFSPDIIIEPNNKAKASPNKDWGRDRWKALAGLLRGAGLRPYQVGSAGTQILEGVRLIETPSFRHGCAVLARARAAVLPEGGLHHAAAALGVKSVVIFGGFISPRQTGYATQANLFTGGQACGMRIQCAHCADAMAKITPALVLAELQRLLT